ncbi:Xaa-Pro dipeptidyl-peptidase [Sporolactobacillus terrae]|uniref:Xaa-Pro dipeptidyl-peptidase n=1 Tax=Sporolactobacillus terrae TaxID=269673 RepID=A0ABX5Q716_9BACL|nr:Xaa-Pro dipeptidyl-peptidase [Sporolactobacillus terrae]QAA22435.1 Xaa-Pro dipeptidyl-peptidase [Sporolactobacillus terrae]QAA25409.1 Xaa-Pro dipeptidyl-peptidase [Sporolactobacillus terrae]UAK17220.1 Xaa-Pro dipeptidyl-peptidase [Sporolactobacillus terrae]
MKNNQFARLTVDHKTVVNELKAIHFYDDQSIGVTSPTEVYQLLLRKAFLTTKEEGSFTNKLKNYLATPSLDLKDYCASKKPVTTEIFYLVALQLLEFLVTEDFAIDHPVEAMHQMQLPTVETKGNWHKDQLLDAWYLLLTTHTKNGQTFLDRLTNQGYFIPFYDLPAREKPLFFNGKAQAVFDPAKLVREVVYVESSVDSDCDGQLDLLKVEILRPSDTEHGLSVPALFTASPYNQGINHEAGSRAMHDVNVPLQAKKANRLTYQDIAYRKEKHSLPAPRPVAGETRHAAETFSRERSYTLNDYFLVRGFAAVYAAGIGTLDSDGVQTCGDPQQTEATKNVIEWLNGKRRAFTNRTDNIAISAWWCNGWVAMTGRSYLGTLATAAATTGVEGLKTIISEAAISSWYDYYREGGLVIAPGGFPGEDADVLAIETQSRMKAPADYILRVKDFFTKQMDQMARGMDRESGNYTPFWDARNYRKSINKIKCDVLMIHGLNDWNVKPGQVEALWQGLRSVPVSKKIILHQGQHIYINAFRSIDYTDMINLWISHELYGVQNGAKEVLPDVIVQDNLIPETWTAYSDWSNPHSDKTVFHLSPGTLTEGCGSNSIQSFKDDLPIDDFKRYTEHIDQWENELISNQKQALHANRLIFKSAPFEKAQIVNGKVAIHVKTASSQPFGMLSFQLIDFGEEKRLNPSPTPIQRMELGCNWREDTLREFTLAKFPTPFKMITKGHLNLQNRENPWKVNELMPNQFYTFEIKLQPTFHKLAAGHQLGLIIYATDFAMTVRGNQAVRYSIDLSDCHLDVPFQ